MAASFLSVAAVSSSSSSSSSSLLHPCNRASFDHHYNGTPILIHATHFPSKSKPKILKLNAQVHLVSLVSLSHCSHPCRALAAFDSWDAQGDTEGTELQDPIEQEDENFEDSEPQLQEEEDRKVQSADAARLYVGNLPYAMTSSELTEIFDEAGRVAFVEIVYDRVTDRSRGFGFVTMGSIEEAQEAIRLFDGSQVGGRTVRVNFPEVPRGGERQVMGPKIRSSYQGFVDSPHKIYAGNLSWSLTSQGLRDAFADRPGLLSAKVIYDRGSGRSRGFGFITFASAEEVESALNSMNGAEVEGRPLRLNFAAQGSPGSPPGLEGKTENSLDSSELFSSISV